MGRVVVWAAPNKQNKAALPPPRDVMIIPSAGGAGLSQAYAENVAFGRQWAAGFKDDRVLLEVGPADSFEAKMVQAAELAKLPPGADDKTIRRRVILFVGHGAAKGVHGSLVTAFDTVPEAGPIHGHTKTITDEVLQLEADLASGKRTVQNPNSAQPTFTGGSGPNFGTQVTAQFRMVQMLRRVGAVFQQKGIAQFILLSCAAGDDTDTMDRLAQVLRARVGSYRNFVTTATHSWKNKRKIPREIVQIWLTPPNASPAARKQLMPVLTFDAEGEANPIESTHEYPKPEVFRPR